MFYKINNYYVEFFQVLSTETYADGAPCLEKLYCLQFNIADKHDGKGPGLLRALAMTGDGGFFTAMTGGRGFIDYFWLVATILLFGI